MSKFQKAYNPKIISLIVSILFLFTNTLYPCPISEDFLRVSIQQQKYKKMLMLMQKKDDVHQKDKKNVAKNILKRTKTPRGKGLLTFSTKNADYVLLDTGLHYVTEFRIDREILQQVDAVVTELAGDVTYEEYGLHEFMENYSQNLGGSEGDFIFIMSLKKPIFGVELPDIKLFRDLGGFMVETLLETSFVAIPATLSIAFALSHYPLYITLPLSLPALSHFTKIMPLGKGWKSINSHLLLSHFYLSDGLRSAAWSKKIEEFIVPEIKQRTNKRPKILIVCGRGHLDIKPYLQHKLLRDFVIGLHSIWRYFPFARNYLSKIVEINFKGDFGKFGKDFEIISEDEFDGQILHRQIIYSMSHKSQNKSGISRRKFLETSGKGVAGMVILPFPELNYDGSQNRFSIDEKIRVLIEKLKDENLDVREKAAEELVQIGIPAVQALINTLRLEEDNELKWRAARILGEIGDTRAIPALIECLREESADVREQAAWALGKIGDQNAFLPLIQALKDQEFRIRYTAGRSLVALLPKVAEFKEAILGFCSLQDMTKEGLLQIKAILERVTVPHSELLEMFTYRREAIRIKTALLSNIVRVYAHPDCHNKTKDFGKANRFSIARVTSDNLEKGNLKFNHENILNVLNLITEELDSHLGDIVLGPKTNLYIITHEMKRYNPDEIFEYAQDYMVESNIHKYDGKDNKNSALNDIKDSEGLTVIWFWGHGGPNHLWFRKGEPGEELSEDMDTPDAISYIELAKQLKERAKRNNDSLKDVIMIIDSCYSYNFGEKLKSELVQSSINEFPVIFTLANRDMEAKDTVFLPALQGVTLGSKHVTLGDLFMTKEKLYIYEDPAIFMSLIDGLYLILKETLNSAFEPIDMVRGFFAEGSNIIIFGENHVKVQHRLIIRDIIDSLKEGEVDYLALELDVIKQGVLNASLDKLTKKGKTAEKEVRKELYKLAESQFWFEPWQKKALNAYVDIILSAHAKGIKIVCIDPREHRGYFKDTGEPVFLDTGQDGYVVVNDKRKTVGEAMMGNILRLKGKVLVLVGQHHAMNNYSIEHAEGSIVTPSLGSLIKEEVASAKIVLQRIVVDTDLRTKADNIISLLNLTKPVGINLANSPFSNMLMPDRYDIKTFGETGDALIYHPSEKSKKPRSSLLKNINKTKRNHKSLENKM